MSSLSQNNNRAANSLHLLVGLFHFALQGCNYGAGGIHNLYTVALGEVVGFGRFAVCTDKHALTLESRDILVRDCL